MDTLLVVFAGRFLEILQYEIFLGKYHSRKSSCFEVKTENNFSQSCYQSISSAISPEGVK